MTRNPLTGIEVHPVIGELSLDKWGQIFQTGYQAFSTGEVRGLAIVRDDRIWVLAMAADEPNRGHGGRFIDALKDAYRVVTVWEILNASLAAMLARRGFKLVVEVEDGERLEGMRWTRQ